MPRSAIPAILVIVVSALACASLPSRIPFIQTPRTPTPVAGGLAAGEVAPIAPAVLSAESLSEIPLHAGYGVRGSWFELYFTDPANPSSAQLTGGVDEHLVEAIEAARLSVHAALYSLTLNNVRQALISAHRRGVDVRLVTESDNLDSQDLQQIMQAGIPVLGDRRESTMHDKFMVIDQREVWTGSMNFTTSGVYLDNNTVIRISSADLARGFESEFAEMFEDDRFSSDPGRPFPTPRLEIAGTAVETYFSPDDGVEAALVDLIGTARESLDFLAYSFTADRLGQAVVSAQQSGVTVRGLMDQDQASSNLGTELTLFRSAGLDVRLDGNPGQMHEKAIIIDHWIVVLGSYNFSRNASEFNDENVLVIFSHPIAQQFTHEFDRLFALASK